VEGEVEGRGEGVGEEGGVGRSGRGGGDEWKDGEKGCE